MGKIKIIGCNSSFWRGRMFLKSMVKMFHYVQEQCFAHSPKNKNKKPKSPIVINARKEMSELAATFWVMNFALVFWSFGSGKVHSGYSKAFCVSHIPQSYLSQTTNYQVNSFSSCFIIQVPFPPFLHIEQMQGKKRGPAQFRNHTPGHYHHPRPSSCQPHFLPTP